jgi:hypothetical protein
LKNKLQPPPPKKKPNKKQSKKINQDKNEKHGLPPQPPQEFVINFFLHSLSLKEKQSIVYYTNGFLYNFGILIQLVNIDMSCKFLYKLAKISNRK